MSTELSPQVLPAPTGAPGEVVSKPAASRARHGAPPPRRRARAQLASVGQTSRAARSAAFVLGTVWLLIVLAPIYYMVLNSFRSQGQYLSVDQWSPAGGLSLSSWGSVVSGSSGLWGDFLRSLVYAGGTIVVVVVLSELASFRVVRKGSRVSRAAFPFVLFGLAIPIYAILIPIYVAMVKVHLYNTLYGLVLATAASQIAVAVLLTVNYVRMVPPELFDAMAVDGASEGRVFASLVWPMSRPVVGVVSIFAGLGAWNNFVLPLILTSSNSTAVLPLGLFKISTTESGYGVNVPVVLAGVVFSVIPLLLLYMLLRRQFVKGIGGFALR